MKKYISKILFLLFLLSPPQNARSQETAKLQGEKLRHAWQKMIPRHATLQYAGGMGMFSAGAGWNYGRRHRWETELLWGFVPSFSDDDAKVTLTLKENYTPFSVALGKGWSAEPLRCGFYLNTVFDENFWIKEPVRYPKKYYDFSTKVRLHIFLGQGISFYDKKLTHKTITLFYEISTCDFYVISACTNRYIHLKDIMNLSVGLKIKLL